MANTPLSGTPRGAQVGGLLALGMLWGGSFMVLKVAVESVPAASVAAARLLIAALILVTIAWLSGHRLPLTWRAWRQYFIMGALAAALPFTLIGWGEVAIDSGLAAILMAVTPLSTLVLAHLFVSDEPMTISRVIGILLGLAGVVVLIGPSALQGLGDHAIRQGAVALGAVCYACGNIVARHLPKESDMTNSAGIMAAAAILWVPVALFVERPWTADPSSASLIAILALGLLPTALATMIYLWLVRTAGATFVSLSNYLVPVIGVFWGVLILDESLNPNAAFALVLVLAGIAVARRGKRGSPAIKEGDSP